MGSTMNAQLANAATLALTLTCPRFRPDIPTTTGRFFNFLFVCSRLLVVWAQHHISYNKRHGMKKPWALTHPEAGCIIHLSGRSLLSGVGIGRLQLRNYETLKL